MLLTIIGFALSSYSWITYAQLVNPLITCYLKLKVYVKQRRPLRDSVCNTAFTKFETAISKKFEKQLQHFTEEEFRKFEELTELFEFVDSIIPLDDGENQDIDARRSSRKRSFFRYYFDDWVLTKGLGDQKACLALALRQKPITVPGLGKGKGDQNLSEWKVGIWVDPG